MAKQEEWRSVEGWPYEVSGDGRIRRLPTEHAQGGIIRPAVYARTKFSADGRKLHPFVHRVVAEAFLGPKPKPGYHVNHKNGDTLDNRAENLEWISCRENQLHALDMGLSCARGEKHPRAKLTADQVREIRARYTGAWGEQTRLAKEYGVTQMLIGKIINRENWRHLDDADATDQVRFAPDVRKLSDEDAEEIRRRYTGKRGEQRALAREYSVTPTTISRVIRHKQRPSGKARRKKLNANNVRRIRQDYADGRASMGELAGRYGVTRQTIRAVVDGSTWQHVT